VLRTYSATGRPPQGVRRPRWSAVIGGDPPRRADCGAHRSACLSGIHWDADCPTAAQSGDELEPARSRWHSSRRGCRLRRRVGSRRALRGPDGAILLGQVSQPLIVQGIWCRPTVSGDSGATVDVYTGPSGSGGTSGTGVVKLTTTSCSPNGTVNSDQKSTQQRQPGNPCRKLGVAERPRHRRRGDDHRRRLPHL
jgi:hypothetical protein